MKKEELEGLLNELARRGAEPVRPDLGEDIKQQIPHRLVRHKIGWDTVNIIIDLRMSRSVAAAAIIITMILLLNLFGGRDSTGGGILQDGVLLIKYWGRAEGVDGHDISAGRLRYEYLLQRGEDVAWYGSWIDPRDSNAVLIQYKLPDGRHQVVFTDGRERQVDAEELIELLTGMLQQKTQ